jgi:hypothetical protein
MTLEQKAADMKRSGFKDATVMKKGCPIKFKPHVCCNCTLVNFYKEK